MRTEGRGMLCTSVHTHTTFCDGADTPAAMAAAAAEMGLQTLGFSGHGYVPQENFGIPPERMGDYCEQIRRLRQHTRQCSQIKQQSDPGHTDYRNKPALYPYSSVQNEKIPAKRQQEHPCSSCINYSSQFPAPPVLFIRRSDIRSASFY